MVFSFLREVEGLRMLMSCRVNCLRLEQLLLSGGYSFFVLRGKAFLEACSRYDLGFKIQVLE